MSLPVSYAHAATGEEAQKKEKRTLAPAPVPATPVWGTPAAPQTHGKAIDEHKWPTPNQAAAPSQRAAFGKSTRWVPIPATVVLASPRQKPKKKKQPRRKEDDADGGRFRRQLPPFYPAFVPFAAPIPPPISAAQDPLQALTLQVDYYFSLENLIRDVFLRQNMGTEGWIDLDLILNFKRVQYIVANLRALLATHEALDAAIVRAVQRCRNVEVGYVNGKLHADARATEVQLRVRDNFERWLLPTRPGK